MKGKQQVIRGLPEKVIKTYDKEVAKLMLKGVRSSREELMRQQLILRYETKS